MITKFHDYFALEQVIFEAYSILADANGFTAARDNLEWFFVDHEANGEKINETQELLSNFLTEYSEATLRVKDRFEDATAKCLAMIGANQQMPCSLQKWQQPLVKNALKQSLTTLTSE